MWKWTFDITFDSQLDSRFTDGMRGFMPDKMLESLQAFIPEVVASPLRLMVKAETGKEAKERVLELAKQAVCNTVPVKDVKLVDLQEVVESPA